MDVLAHALWAGAGVMLAQRRWTIGPGTATATVALAVAPDVPHLLPVIGWSVFGGGGAATVRDYAIAAPGQEPALPSWVDWLSHNLHCVRVHAFERLLPVAGAVADHARGPRRPGVECAGVHRRELRGAGGDVPLAPAAKAARARGVQAMRTPSSPTLHRELPWASVNAQRDDQWFSAPWPCARPGCTDTPCPGPTRTPDRAGRVVPAHRADDRPRRPIPCLGPACRAATGPIPALPAM